MAAKQQISEDEKQMFLQCAPGVLLIALIAIYRFSENPSALALVYLLGIIGMACICVYEVRCFIRNETMHSKYGRSLTYDDDHKIERMFYALAYAAFYLAMIYGLLENWKGSL